MRITKHEFMLALSIGVMGFVFSTRAWLMFLAGLNPLEGFIVYYILLYSTLFVLSKMGLVVFGLRIKSVTQTFGLLLLAFAFFATINFESAYVQIVTMGPDMLASPLYAQCEDGLLWWLWHDIIGIQDPETARIIALSVSPFFIALLGLAFTSGKVRLHTGKI